MRKHITPDKWKHFWVGIPLGIILQAVCFYFFAQLLSAIIWAFLLLVVICYGFELFSKITKLGHHDIIDAVAGILGGVIGAGLVIVLKLLHIF